MYAVFGNAENTQRIIPNWGKPKKTKVYENKYVSLSNKN